jgi:hypothetical protein
VTLFPDAGKEQSAAGLMTGQIDSGGNYTISSGGKPGAPLGKYKATVTPSMVPTGGDKPPALGFNAMYKDQAKTPLRIEVVASGGAYDLKLEK